MRWCNSVEMQVYTKSNTCSVRATNKINRADNKQSFETNTGKWSARTKKLCKNQDTDKSRMLISQRDYNYHYMLVNMYVYNSETSGNKGWLWKLTVTDRIMYKWLMAAFIAEIGQYYTNSSIGIPNARFSTWANACYTCVFPRTLTNSS